MAGRQADGCQLGALNIAGGGFRFCYSVFSTYNFDTY
jgi:hypothetical protein